MSDISDFRHTTQADSGPARPKPPPPPPRKPAPPPPKPAKIAGAQTIPIHEAIKRVSMVESSPTAKSSNQSYSSIQCDSPSNSGRVVDYGEVESKPNPLREYMKNNRPITPPPNVLDDSQSAKGSTHNEPIENSYGNNVVNDEEKQQPSGLSSHSTKSLTKSTIKKRTHSFRDCGPGEPNNMIYHKIRLSATWLYVAILMHIGQWLMLLNVGHSALPPGAMAVLLFLVVLITGLFIAARLMTKKSHLASRRNIKLKANTCTPDDEKDDMPDRAVYCIAFAAILEGICYALYTSVTAGNNSQLVDKGFYTQNVMLQTLRFTSITLLGIHRTVRPANRIDPMRTVLEVRE